ncbi:hypothetical protein GCM10025868_29700 [Angustibacter aerolatus]|uniref:Uncharacterized protein n=1 Tax=Angustibacter aerolatus TaxID=1162965 RepID=A0ABQ6JHK9_9ACTN|nr:hypothetical protein [Angustibacter aerolatus]GMA87720.1 hypothetical protein GCM10025868_29700 [Angustibacter aerolatus]
MLRDLALRALTLPVPQIGQNPTTRTLVRLPTWFWTDGGDFREWSITATAGEPANSATVTATPAEFFVAGGGQRRECSVPAGTTAWHQGAANTSGCTLEFERASIEGPYRVTGTTSTARPGPARSQGLPALVGRWPTRRCATASRRSRSPRCSRSSPAAGDVGQSSAQGPVFCSPTGTSTGVRLPAGASGHDHAGS